MTDEVTAMMLVPRKAEQMVVDAAPAALVVDDDPEVRRYVSNVLSEFGLSVTEAEDLHGAAEAVNQARFCMAFLDKCLPDGDGVQFSRSLLEKYTGMPVVIITGQGSGEEAVNAIDDGVFGYIPKPCSPAKIRDMVTRILGTYLSPQVGDGVLLGSTQRRDKERVLIAKSPAMIEVSILAQKIAKMNRHVLIQGATGTGKEVVARNIHELSSRADKKFVDVNCGAIPQELIEAELFGHVMGAFTSANKDRVGLFEEANGGTIFLDEITETSPAFQVKLLRVLQEGKIRRVGSNQEIKLDVRVVAASNRDVRDEVSAGRFRQDLYFRLKGSEIYLPPLRERREDIIPMAEHFADRSAARIGRQVVLTKAVLDILRAFDWPGNVRELENVVDYAVQSCSGKVLVSDLPKELRVSTGDAGMDEQDVIGTCEEIMPLEEMERRYMEMALKRYGGNKTRAAKALGIDRSRFYYKSEVRGGAASEGDSSEASAE